MTISKANDKNAACNKSFHGPHVSLSWALHTNVHMPFFFVYRSGFTKLLTVLTPESLSKTINFNFKLIVNEQLI